MAFRKQAPCVRAAHFVDQPRWIPCSLGYGPIGAFTGSVGGSVPSVLFPPAATYRVWRVGRARACSPRAGESARDR